jgi:hypothetical protein
MPTRPIPRRRGHWFSGCLMEMRMILATLVRRIEITIPDGFGPDFVTELSMHPGERGMPTDVKFRQET